MAPTSHIETASQPTVGAGSSASAPRLAPIADEAIEGWRDDDHAEALACFARGAVSLFARIPRTRALGIEGAGLLQPARRALAIRSPCSADEARAFFETHFMPLAFPAEGFVTGYYEPEVEASRTRDAHFHVPLYRRPDDLVDVGEDGPLGWDPHVRFARRTEAGLAPHPDRAAIEAGALADRGLELAFVADPVDAYFIHVQGSARLRLRDGSTLRIAFAAKSGHPYTSIGKRAVERGYLAVDRADKDGLETWLKANREIGAALMRENRSFIFFREVEGLQPDDGPLGAAGVPLTPGRSLAVDRNLMTFHLPVFVAASSLADPYRPDRPFRRLMIAQDTGSAIVGAVRADFFWGWGDDAEAAAGRMKQPLRMWALWPRSS